MRKFRNVALAATTAVALTLGSTAVASAAETPSAFEQLSSAVKNVDTSKDETIPSQIGNELDKETPVNGRDLLGTETDENAPAWAQIWRDVTYVGVAGTVIGAIIAGINWLKFQGILPY